MNKALSPAANKYVFYCREPLGLMYIFSSFAGSHLIRSRLHFIGKKQKADTTNFMCFRTALNFLVTLLVWGKCHITCPADAFNGEKKGHMVVQQIGNATCSFSHSHEYLRLASNGIFELSCKKKHFSLFHHCAVWGVSHGLFLTLFHPHVAQECILVVQWIKMPCQRGSKKENLHSELSVIFPPCLCHGKIVKSSPSSHKLAGRFISRLTFSLEVPPGTWASALWREMTGLLLGAAVVESYSLASSPLSLSYFSPSLSLTLFLSPYEAFQKVMTAT